MKQLGKNIAYLIDQLSGDSEQARINLRAHQVRDRYRQAIEVVYQTNAELFLSHTNNVYIMMQDGVRTLIVYVDESIYAAELNAQRELIKLKLLELFREEIEEFKIFVSRGQYKSYHPYLDEENQAYAIKHVEPLPPLSYDDEQKVEEVASTVEDDRVRKSLEKAMRADMARKMVKNGIEY